jgi:SAM-dependent methyltransferase
VFRQKGRRTGEYDWTEAWDIHRILKSLGIKDGVVDVGCGEGQLVGYLRARGITAVGCDVAENGCGSYCDATRPGTIPNGRVWVLQHVIEHVPTETWLPLFRHAIEAGVEYIIIVAPGHFWIDETHYCNHFTPLLGTGKYAGNYGEVVMCGLNDLRQLLRQAGYTGVATFVDTHTLTHPWDLDYIVIAGKSKHVLRKLLPWILRRMLVKIKALFATP